MVALQREKRRLIEHPPLTTSSTVTDHSPLPATNVDAGVLLMFSSLDLFAPFLRATGRLPR
jgi:hypothetical protein